MQLADQEFETTMINMLKVPIEKVDKIQVQMSNVSREMKTLRKNQRKLITVTEMRNTFDGFISRPDTRKERVGELEDMSIEIPKLKEEEKGKKKTEGRKKTQQNIRELWDK